MKRDSLSPNKYQDFKYMAVITDMQLEQNQTKGTEPNGNRHTKT